ncbi:MAG: PIN domain nuclease [Alphaproteobacteria bacterium CG_4_10_14_0_2_um_filter_63_37]|nr:MAG: hypothetical protein AUJ55_04650 [Proteobacteria bacterium CG1_02_64_396]PJA24628.1 MAG: PIN domain nuclease [Alphaproteobacteria bacterium CG_4_10_14_0_2_um_filter_63_37]
MFKVLVDLNVVLDVLLDRPSLGPTSTQLLVLVDQKRLEGWLCASSIDTLDYLLRRSLKRDPLPHIRTLREILRIAPVDEAVIDAALNLGWGDLEDAIVHESARLSGLHAIVTRNTRNFARATLPVLTPEQFLDAHQGLTPSP